MVSWDKRREVQYFDFSMYLAASCILLYLLGRHALLVGSRLKPRELGMGQCTKALMTWIKGLCGEQPTAERGPRHKEQEESDGKLHLNLIFYGTFGCLLWFLLFFMNCLLLYVSDAFFGWLPFPLCYYFVPIGSIFMLFARLCLYTVLTARLFLAFDGTFFGYRRRTLYSIYAMIAAYGLCFAVLMVVILRGERTHYHANGKAIHYCTPDAPLTFYALLVMGDLFFNILVLVLFVRALRKMFANTEKFMDEKKFKEDRTENVDMYLLPLKYTLLTVVAVTSSVLTWPLYGLTGAISLVPIDTVVNCVALVFMTKRWKPVYEIICGPLLRCVAKMNCLPADFVQKELVEVVTRMRPNLVATKTVPSPRGTETSTQLSL